MKNDKIAVIVPVYNVDKYLSRCIDSILAQSYSNFLLILVDDGSTDNSSKICDVYSKQDERIIVIHKQNGGLSAARNEGIECALSSEITFLTFIDSDDWIIRDYLLKLYSITVDNEADIGMCKFYRTAGDEKVIEESDYAVSVETPTEVWCKDRMNATVAVGKLYRRELFLGLRYPLGKVNEDEFTTYKLLFKCERIAIISAQMYQYFMSDNSIMRSEWSPKRLDCLEAYREQIAFFSQNGVNIEAIIKSERDYFQHSIKSKRYLEVLHPKYQEYKSYVNSELKKAFCLYAKHVGVKKALAYWCEVRLINPLKRK